MTRLRAEVKKGDKEILVETGLDLVPGDRVAILASSYAHDTSDDVFIETYNNETGKVTLGGSLKYYHWGQDQSTGPEYNGVDMRAEVLLLTRNIVIAGEDVESWGCNIVTSDIVEPDLTMRYGQLILDNVEIYNCSQIDTYKSAIRFESAETELSSVTNCSLHNGYSWAINVKKSANVYIADNVIYNFRPIGVAI
jgi:hypothetical protein